jgi:hypothetical protein
MSLVYANGPYAVVEEALSSLATGTPLTQAQIQQIAAIAMGAAVAVEVFPGGYYCDGDTVIVPTSTVDGFVYSRAQLEYLPFPYSTARASAYTPGQTTPPSLAARGAGGNLLEMYGWYVDKATGVVHLRTGYYVQGGSETDPNDGTVCVVVVGNRNR